MLKLKENTTEFHYYPPGTYYIIEFNLNFKIFYYLISCIIESRIIQWCLRRKIGKQDRLMECGSASILFMLSDIAIPHYSGYNKKQLIKACYIKPIFFQVFRTDIRDAEESDLRRRESKVVD